MADPRIRVLELRSVLGTGGGPEKTILLGAARTHPDIEVTVCYVRDARDPVFRLGERAAALGVDYVEVPERHSFDFRAWRTLAALVRDRGIQIVHGHEYKTDFLSWWLSRRTHAVPLATVHGWSGDSTRERLVYYPVDKRLLTRFPHVIAVSSVIKHELLRKGVRPDRVTVLLNAVDESVYVRSADRRERIRRDLGIANSETVIGSVGRLEKEKRYDLLLEAVAPLLLSKGSTPTRVRVLIAGSGSLQGHLAKQANELGVGDRVTLLGHRDDALDVHHAFDVFAQASETEGTPNAVLEAMALETPVVATDVGGTRELVTSGVHALLVPKHDVTALREALMNVLRDPDAARQRAVAARLRVETDLSFEARTRSLETIYRHLVRCPAPMNPSQGPVHA